MSKQSEAKRIQGYNAKPTPRCCGTCQHFESIIETSIGWDKREYKEEKQLRCGLGSFAVRKLALCDQYIKNT